MEVSWILSSACFLSYASLCSEHYATVYDALDSHNNCGNYFVYIAGEEIEAKALFTLTFPSSYIYKVSQDLNTRLNDAKTRTLVMMLGCLYILCFKSVRDFFFLTWYFKINF